MTHFVVTTRTGNQYRVPDVPAAKETSAARSGVKIEQVEVPNVRQQGFMFKPRGADRWQDWPAWEDCND